MRVAPPDTPPPPSTLYLFAAWFCRLGRPFFSRREAGVDEDFVPVEQALLIERVEEGVPDFDQHIFAFPLDQSPPTGARRRVSLRQVSPASTAAEHPQDAFQARPIVRRRSPSFGGSFPLGYEPFDLVPLLVRDEDFVSSGHRKVSFQRPS